MIAAIAGVLKNQHNIIYIQDVVIKQATQYITNSLSLAEKKNTKLLAACDLINYVDRKILSFFFSKMLLTQLMK